MSFHRRVALACRLFQALPVENRDPPVGVFDQPGFLQSARHNRHRGPRRPQHHRQKLMAEVKLILTDAIVRHQQPTTAALLHRMQRHTAGRLHHQHQQAL